MKLLVLTLGLSAACLAVPWPAIAAPAAGAASGVPTAPLAPVARALDINRASAAELVRLPGGSGAEAARIVAGRPYGSKGQLVSRQAVDVARYGEIKFLVFAGQSRRNAPKQAPPAAAAK